MLKKILISFLKTFREVVILFMAEAVAFLFLLAVYMFISKFFGVNLVKVIANNIFLSIITLGILFGGAGFIAIRIFNLNRDR